MNVQTFVAQRSVERLDKGVIRRLARPRKIDPGPVMIGPKIDEVTGKFRAVVGKKIFWSAALPNETVQNLHDMFAAKTLTKFDGKTITTEHVDHGQRSELVTIAELIVNEIEAPDFVRPHWRVSRFAMHDHLAAARPFAPQNKAFLAIETVNEVLADSPSFSSQHDVDAPIAIANPCLHDLVHALADFQTRIPNARLPLG